MTKSKKVFSIIISLVLLSTLLSVSVFAQKKYYSFSVTTGNGNDGKAFTSANPKDDNEQACYVYSTKNNLIAGDYFYYNVRRYPSSTGTQVLGYKRITPNMIPRYVGTYHTYSAKGTHLYLEVDTDYMIVSTDGYWYS